MERNRRETKTGLVEKQGSKDTAKVSVEKRIAHKIYKKVIKKTTTFLVDTKGYDVSVGDKVTIQSCKPISKNKSWRIINIINKGNEN